MLFLMLSARDIKRPDSAPTHPTHLKVIQKHVPKDTALEILEELMTVPGNKSLRETIERMYNRARQANRPTRQIPRFVR